MPPPAGRDGEFQWAAPLPRGFYARTALDVARDLLGCVIVRRLPGPSGTPLLAGRIVETEAYVGESDRACHARAGKTARNAVMYGPPGHAYVYFIYGVYDMMNVVCNAPGTPEAVLIRALEPVHDRVAMRALRGVRRDEDLASGPGKLCRALAITRTLNGADLCAPPLWIAPGTLRLGERIRRGPRIGVDYAGPDAKRPWRFYLDPNPHVSKHAPRAVRVPDAAAGRRRLRLR